MGRIMQVDILWSIIIQTGEDFFILLDLGRRISTCGKWISTAHIMRDNITASFCLLLADIMGYGFQSNIS